MKTVFTLACVICMVLPQLLFAQEKDDLGKYIQRLRDDYNGARKETGFMSAGSDFLYAQDYFDAKNYSSSEWYYTDVLKKEKDNPYANYQLAIALIRQNDPQKKEQAQEYLQNAFRLNPSLKERYKSDIPDEPVANQSQPKNTNKNIPNDNAGTANTAEKGLDAYIERIKKSWTTGGTETAMLSAGNAALYGIEFYERNEFSSAAANFKLSLAKDQNNPYVNYMLAVSLAAQGKSEEAKSYRDKAFSADTSLNQRYENDLLKAQQEWSKIKAAKKPKTTPAEKPKYGGKLVFGNYTCHQTVYNGANASAAFSFQYKGYFELKANGTYRWLDNGSTGKYRYDPKTGNITWLSGYFKNNAKSTKYRINAKTAQMTVNFTDVYRWECGCDQN